MSPFPKRAALLVLSMASLIGTGCSEPLESEIAPYRSEKDSVVLPHTKPVPYDLIGRVTAAIVGLRAAE